MELYNAMLELVKYRTHKKDLEDEMQMVFNSKVEGDMAAREYDMIKEDIEETEYRIGILSN